MSSFPSKFKYGLFSLLFIVVGFLAGHQWHKWNIYSNIAKDENVLAVVGDTAITVEEFMHAYHYRGGENVAQFDSNALLNELILTRAMVAQATMKGIVNDYETQHGIDNLIVGKLKQKELEPRLKAINIDNATINQHYLKHQQDFIAPERRRFAVVMQNKGSDIPDSQRNQYATSVHNILKQGLIDFEPFHFGGLSVEQSDHQASRYRGGEIGWFTENQQTRYPDSIITAGFALKNTGDLSPPIWTQDTLYFIRLMEKQPAHIKSLDEVDSIIKHKLILSSTNQVKRDFESQTIANVEITVFEDKLPADL
jgi:hypothetical protein